MDLKILRIKPDILALFLGGPSLSEVSLSKDTAHEELGEDSGELKDESVSDGTGGGTSKAVTVRSFKVQIFGMCARHLTFKDQVVT